MPDPFPNQQPSILGPAEDGFAITPHDTNDLAQTTRAIWVGADGNIALVTRAGTTLTLSGAKAGTLIPIRATRVLATGTTPSMNLVGLY